MRRVLLVLAVLATALVVAVSAFGRTAAPKLTGTVGPGFTISLTQNGKKVKTLRSGTYTFVIRDKASIHNYTLEQQSGGGFSKKLTSVSFVGTKTITVKLTKGKWKYYCAPHEPSMFGFFTVT